MSIQLKSKEARRLSDLVTTPMSAERAPDIETAAIAIHHASGLLDIPPLDEQDEAFAAAMVGQRLPQLRWAAEHGPLPGHVQDDQLQGRL